MHESSSSNGFSSTATMPKKQVMPESFCLIQRTVDLINNEISKNNYQRHAEDICEYITFCQKGVFVIDLFYVTQLWEHLLNKYEQVPEYDGLMENLLELTQYPPRLTKHSEVLTYSQDLEEYFTILGVVVVTIPDSLRPRVVTYLKKLFKQHYEDKEYLTLETRLRAVENSRMLEIISAVLLLVPKDYYESLLEIIILLLSSNKCCETLLTGNVLNTVFIRFNSRWAEDLMFKAKSNLEKDNTKRYITHYESGMCVIWNLLKYLKTNRSLLPKVPHVSHRALWTIRILFRYFAKHNNKSMERNHILAIVMMLLNLFPDIEFVSSGLAEDILKISVWSSNFFEGVKDNFQVLLKKTEDDAVCINQLSAIICYLINYSAGVTLINDFCVTYRILKVIKKHKKDLGWSSAYTNEVGIFGWNAIKTLFVHTFDQFLDNNGPYIIISYIKKHDILNDNMNLLERALNTLNFTLSHDRKNLVKNGIFLNDGFSVIFSLGSKILKQCVPNRVTQKCIEHTYCILTLLNPENANCDESIIEIFLYYTRKILNPPGDEPFYNNGILVCLLDLICVCVERSSKFTETFVKAGCVYQLLDILEIFPFMVQLITLKLITNLCETSSCVAFLMTWKSKTGSSFIPLLLDIFRQENKKLKVKQKFNGQIADYHYPLMGKEQWIQTYCFHNYVNSHPCIADLELSTRPKIYAIITMLQERHADKIEVIKEVYKINDTLSAKDQVTMLLAENFFGLKLGEAWKELNAEFKKIKFTPVCADKELIAHLIERINRWAKHLQEVQERILNDDLIMENVSEMSLYNALTEARLQEALESFAELKFLARCTEKIFRVSQVYEMAENVCQVGTECEPISTHNLKSSIIGFNQIVKMKSDVKKLSIDTLPSLVSPISSDVTISNEK